MAPKCQPVPHAHGVGQLPGLGREIAEGVEVLAGASVKGVPIELDDDAELRIRHILIGGASRGTAHALPVGTGKSVRTLDLVQLLPLEHRERAVTDVAEHAADEGAPRQSAPYRERVQDAVRCGAPR